MKPLRFVVPGPPVSKARTRTKNGQHFTDAKTRAHEKHIAGRAMLAARGAGWKKTGGSIAITIKLFYTTHYRRDLDRAVNAVLDGITQSGHVWEDDSQVDDVWATREYVESNPRTEVEIEVMG